MDEKMKKYWDEWQQEPYKRMYEGRTNFWSFVERFISEFEVKSIFEVGGGYGKLGELVDSYTCVELNKRACETMKTTYNYIHGDFSDIRITNDLIGKDLFIACAVIEHCDGFEKFLQKALEAQPKLLIVSFFKGLRKKRKSKIFACKNKEHKKFYNNTYSRKELEEFLKRNGVFEKSKIISSPHFQKGKTREKPVLLINLCSAERFNERVENILGVSNEKD